MAGISTDPDAVELKELAPVDEYPVSTLSDSELDVSMTHQPLRPGGIALDLEGSKEDDPPDAVRSAPAPDEDDVTHLKETEGSSSESDAKCAQSGEIVTRFDKGKRRADRWKRVEQGWDMSVGVLSSAEEERAGETRVELTVPGEIDMAGVLTGTIVPIYQRLRFDPPIETPAGPISEGVLHDPRLGPGRADSDAMPSIEPRPKISFYIDCEVGAKVHSVDIATRPVKLDKGWWKQQGAARDTKMTAWSGTLTLRDTGPTNRLFKAWRGTVSTDMRERYVLLDHPGVDACAETGDLVFVPRSVRGNTVTWTMEGRFNVSYVLGPSLSRGGVSVCRTEKNSGIEDPKVGQVTGGDPTATSGPLEMPTTALEVASTPAEGTEQTAQEVGSTETGGAAVAHVLRPRKLQKKPRIPKILPPFPGCQDCATQCESCERTRQQRSVGPV